MLLKRICLATGDEFKNAETDIPDTDTLVENVLQGKLIPIRVDGKAIYLKAELIHFFEEDKSGTGSQQND